jgi:uncharacterized membrane protein YeiH
VITPFGIPLWAELAAVGRGALQGALFAGAFTDRRIDVLGVAAAAGAVLLVVLVAVGLPVLNAAIAAVVLTAAIRLFAVRFGWSFPEQQALVVRRRRLRLA